MSEPTRPALRWHGGKWRLAPWIIAHMPAHRCYVEPFGGAASVLIRKPRAYAEVYNDLDDWVVNLFRVLRDDVKARRLRDLLHLTPFARTEYEAADLSAPDLNDVERARQLVVRAFMGFGSAAHNGRSTGFRANSNRSHTTPAMDWRGYPEALDALIDRVRGVVIENRDALVVMAQHDGPDTVHYVDPPYVHATRSQRTKDYSYRHEMNDGQHEALLGELCRLEGMVLLSGYPSPLYDPLAAAGWSCLTTEALADGARPRVECLWLNPSATARRPVVDVTDQLGLFA